jgi:hypothetical protein
MIRVLYFVRSIATIVLCLAAIPAAHANLLTNGGFETEIGTPTPSFPPPSWIASGNGMAIDTFFPATGTYDVAFTALSTDPNAGILSQTVGTTSGLGYTLSFSLLDQSLIPGADAFAVSFGGFSTTVLGSILTPSTYTFVMLAIPGSDVVGSSTTVSFQGLIDPSSGGIFNLDDVSLTSAAIPEPPAAMLFAVAVGLLGLLTMQREISTKR